MSTNATNEPVGKKATPEKQTSQAPTLSLPKGGGAIRGLGEKFAANPVTGTGSMTVPIATSPGRSGFGPQLALSYDSGAGNGPFGLGWSLGLPQITRKIDKGLPRYLDGQDQVSDSDVFILSGAEDLVPVLRQATSGKLEIHDDPRSVGGVAYRVRRYRPRIEGLFARIERWTNTASGEIHWRSISKDNITTLYGRDNNSRIFDPVDPNPAHPTRVFNWLICHSYNDKGNAMSYEYVPENGAGVDLAQTHEHNRGDNDDPSRSANRYLKRIHYGNATSLLAGGQPIPVLGPDLSTMKWLFEVVFDFGEGHYQSLSAPADDPQFVRSQSGTPADAWPIRQDPFSTYRAGFEVRTYRLCRRVLMFHHFETELGTPDYLVRSTDFIYREESIASFITSVTQSGYVCPDIAADPTRYLKKSLPPVEFDYTRATLDPKVEEVAAESLENLPLGLDGSAYQWVDLDGEGVSGILTQQAGDWFYKRNLGPLPTTNGSGMTEVRARFAPLERVASLPALATAFSPHQFLDLAGDGTLDLVEFSGPTPGFYERTDDEDWEPFTPFRSLPNLRWDDPDVRFVDLDGDGHADVLVTEDEVFTWYRSLGEGGFEPGGPVYQLHDEERGPRLVSDSPTERIHLADLSGDGLIDLVRIRNGEVCYWPNLGYGRFGAKVTMDNSPWFDDLDIFDQKRIRLADIDGSGTTDILYLGANQIAIYRNQSGNSFSDPEYLTDFPRVDNLTSVQAVDLLGNGTACLVWSSSLHSDASRQMRYIDLMGGQKPHLLIKTVNNLGAETIVSYAPSTKFYLADKLAGKPWITKLPFPVHVIERVETWDHISRNRFVSRYTYHHGYFDGEEREFRGFGRVDQWDTEEFAALSAGDSLTSLEAETAGVRLSATNLDAASHVPPARTVTWFHTGAYLKGEKISHQMAREYYGAPKETDPNFEQELKEFEATLLPDTVFPDGLAADEKREACRALKGAMLRQEIYADDAPEGASEEIIKRAETPYTVTEQNFSIERLQPRAGNRHAVFFTHAREALSYHYERNPEDPRVGHAITLEVDHYGSVLKSVAIGYGRRQSPLPEQKDRDKQTQTLITYTENNVTNPIDDTLHPDDYRSPLPSGARTYELTGYPLENAALRFEISDFVEPDLTDPKKRRQLHVFDNEISYEEQATAGLQRRLIEHVRTLYRKNDLTGPSPLGEVESLALPFESYQLAFTANLAEQIFVAENKNPHRPTVAELAVIFSEEGRHVHWKADANSPADTHWWIPSGRVFFAADTEQELAEARAHFFLPRRFRDPFDQDTRVRYDTHDLLPAETRDPLDNVVTVETTNDRGQTRVCIDYRVLQPDWITDPNGNRSRVAFDALGLVAGSAIMGKATGPKEGDGLDDFTADLTLAKVEDFFAEPRQPGPTNSESEATPIVHELLANATTRIIYDLERFRRTQKANPTAPEHWEPSFAATIARETHVTDLSQNQQSKLQVSFSYSDGFGREIQKKIPAESGPLDLDDPNSPFVNPRWVGSGWTIFNNKGKPVRQYEPFFSSLPDRRHRFEFAHKEGVSAVLFYDPVERVVATLHPNHTYEKVIFDPWQQTTSDVNDTVLNADGTTDPKADEDVEGLFSRLAEEEYLPTWYEERIAKVANDPERIAAEKAAVHRQTPVCAHFDTLSRPFLSIAHNRFERIKRDNTVETVNEFYFTRTEWDIEGNQRSVTDAKDRIVMRYDYDMLGNRIHQASMEAGERWTLNSVASKPIRRWDSREQIFTTEYDALQRPTRLFLSDADEDNQLVEYTVYGENHPKALDLNLRGKVFLVLDSAGVVLSLARDVRPDESNELRTHLTGAGVAKAFDFKGNPLRSTRVLAVQYQETVDWRDLEALLDVAPDETLDLNAIARRFEEKELVEAEAFSSATSFDALNRPIELVAPDRSVLNPAYNEAGLLEALDGRVRDPADTPRLIPKQFIENIDYNAKGQRVLIEYSNGAKTVYRYDPFTFRLTDLFTTRGSRFPDDCSKKDSGEAACANPPESCPKPRRAPCGLQNLHYSYDPAGNITLIRDDAQQTIYFDGQVVKPQNEYTYDAIYRLIVAKGREHKGQVGQPWTTYNDAERVGLPLPHPRDGQAMRNYTERYQYDAVGNFDHLLHQAENGQGNWQRDYSYEGLSLIPEDWAQNRVNNRLTRTTVSGQGLPATPEPYTHDEHGNMTSMPHLAKMKWDFKDQLQMTRRQQAHAEDEDGIQHEGERTYYVYDAGGQRVRKVTESANETKRKERIYLGGLEIYRQYSDVQTNPTLERETLHVTDDKQRIALLETRTKGRDEFAPQVVRFQFSNHLGSAMLELNEDATPITYEEYYPYGSTSYQGVKGDLDPPPKRYRYSGKERDDESGLCYYATRYYASWLARWTSCDELTFTSEEGLAPIHCYLPFDANPVRLIDPDGRATKDTTRPIIDRRLKAAVARIAPQHARSMTQAEAEVPWSGDFLEWKREVGKRAHKLTQNWALENIEGAVVPTTKSVGESGATIPDILLTAKGEEAVIELTSREEGFLTPSKQIQLSKQYEVARKLGYAHVQISDGKWGIISAKEVRNMVAEAGWTENIVNANVLTVLMGALSLLTTYTEMGNAAIEAEDKDSFAPLAEELTGQWSMLTYGTAGGAFFGLLVGGLPGSLLFSVAGGLAISYWAHSEGKEAMARQNETEEEQKRGLYEWRADQEPQP